MDVNIPPPNHIKVLNGQGWVGLLNTMGTEVDITNAARVSFGKKKDKFDDDDLKLLNYLIKHKHTTPLEHVTLTFSVYCPLFVRSQWMRHRCLSGDSLVRISGENFAGNATMEYLYKLWMSGQKMPSLVSYDENTKEFIKTEIKEVVLNGHKSVYKLTLKNGLKLKGTNDHKILTKNGWKELCTLNTNDSVITVGREEDGGFTPRPIPVDTIVAAGHENVYDIVVNHSCHNFVADGMVVHNCWSYNEISRRYTDEEIAFYLPKNLREQSTSNKQASVTGSHVENESSLICDMDIAQIQAFQLYKKLLDAGVCREQARGILPQNMMTTYWATVDLHNLISFLRLRCDSHAQAEIREYADAVKELIRPIYPHVVAAFEADMFES